MATLTAWLGERGRPVFRKCVLTGRATEKTGEKGGVLNCGETLDRGKRGRGTKKLPPRGEKSVIGHDPNILLK